MINCTLPASRRLGFSVSEVLIVLALIGILSGVAFGVFSRVESSTHTTKLSSDVASLNRSVDAYLASGGNLSAADSIEKALTRLKSTAANPEKTPGYSGAFVDHRMEPIPMAADEVNQAMDRVIWDHKNKRFAITKAAVNGAKGFRLNPALAAKEIVEDNRTLRFTLASHNAWIWDHKDADGNAVAAPDPLPTTGVSEEELPPYVAPRGQLQPPLIETPGGTREYEEFPLFVTIQNPNPSAHSQLMYTVNGGPWLPYEEPISVQPNQEVSSFVQSTTADHYSSLSTSTYYSASPQQFAGNSDGDFNNATGQVNMRTVYGDGYFEWGQWSEARYQTGSFLEFEGASFEAITADEFFRLGSLAYYNSSIFEGTAAEIVTLTVDLNLTTPELQESFDFDLELINTPNNWWLSEDQKADYVLINNPVMNFTTLLNGKQYALELSFAYTGNDGYAEVNQFHVHEGSETSAELMGRFVEVETED